MTENLFGFKYKWFTFVLHKIVFTFGFLGILGGRLADCKAAFKIKFLSSPHPDP